MTQFFFEVLSAWGAYIRPAEKVTFENVKLETRGDDGRERIDLDGHRRFSGDLEVEMVRCKGGAVFGH